MVGAMSRTWAPWITRFLMTEPPFIAQMPVPCATFGSSDRYECVLKM